MSPSKSMSSLLLEYREQLIYEVVRKRFARQSNRILSEYIKCLGKSPMTTSITVIVALTTALANSDIGSKAIASCLHALENMLTNRLNSSNISQVQNSNSIDGKANGSQNHSRPKISQHGKDECIRWITDVNESLLPVDDAVSEVVQNHGTEADTLEAMSIESNNRELMQMNENCPSSSMTRDDCSVRSTNQIPPTDSAVSVEQTSSDTQNEPLKLSTPSVQDDQPAVKENKPNELEIESRPKKAKKRAKIVTSSESSYPCSSRSDTCSQMRPSRNSEPMVVSQNKADSAKLEEFMSDLKKSVGCGMDADTMAFLELLVETFRRDQNVMRSVKDSWNLQNPGLKHHNPLDASFARRSFVKLTASLNLLRRAALVVDAVKEDSKKKS